MGLFKAVNKFFKGPEAPDSPPYQYLAQQEAAGNQEASRSANTANRPDLHGPGFDQTWDQPDPDNPDKWVGTYALSPEGQKAFESGERFTRGLSQIGEKSLGQLSNVFNTPYQLPGGSIPQYRGPQGGLPQYQGPQGDMPQYQGPEGDMPTYGAHRQGVVDAMMSRVNTDIGRDRESTRSKLIARGIPEGSEAFSRAMEMSDRKQTDARQQAEIAAEQMAGMGYSSALSGRKLQGLEDLTGFQTGMQSREQGRMEGLTGFQTGLDSRQQGFLESGQQHRADLLTRQQQLQEDQLARSIPFNEAMALQAGSQVASPGFQPYGQQQMVGGPEYLNAGTAQGTYDLGASNMKTEFGNNMMSGLFGLGSSYLGRPR